MAAVLSYQTQLCYKRIPDSINTEKMLQNYCFDYLNNRECLMAQQPYVFAQFLSLIPQVPDSKKKSKSYQTVVGKVSETTPSVKTLFSLT